MHYTRKPLCRALSFTKDALYTADKVWGLTTSDIPVLVVDASLLLAK